MPMSINIQPPDPDGPRISSASPKQSANGETAAADKLVPWWCAPTRPWLQWATTALGLAGLAAWLGTAPALGALLLLVLVTTLAQVRAYRATLNRMLSPTPEKTPPDTFSTSHASRAQDVFDSHDPTA